MHWLTRAMKKCLVPQGQAWQYNSTSKWLKTPFCLAHSTYEMEIHVFLLSKQCRREPKCLPWDPTWQSMSRTLRRQCYLPPFQTSGDPSHSQKPKLCLPLRALPLKVILTPLFWLIFRLNLFIDSTFRHNGIRCSSGNTLYSFLPHVFMLSLGLEDSLSY